MHHLVTRALQGLFLAAGITVLGGSAQSAADVTVIELTQTGCQFLESENGLDHGYKTTRKADCEAINERTGKARLAKAKTLELEPGEYIFWVTNKNVPYALGFWLRGEGLLGRATLPSVSGGGLVEGVTKEYRIKLSKGEYLYSCPLNPTPNYRIVVKS